jgi:hypothetical protein
MVSNLVLILFFIFGLWLLALTIFTFNIFSHYNKLTKGTTDKGLKSILEGLLKEASLVRSEISHLKDYASKVQKEGLFHIQKIGLVRFNPFKDTGGDQSFILSLIDGNDTGVIISGLYSRSGTRWYAKRIIEGKAVDHELSDEERKALKEAKGI